MSEPETPEAPRELHPASQGEDVTNLQTALFNAGYDPGPVDGVYGPKTEAVVKALQDQLGLTPDGVTGPPTWRALSERDGANFLRDFPLRRMLHGASEGPDVAELQEALAAAGLISGEPNGTYSAGTESAVKRFQNNEGLPMTGVLDAATRALLMPVRIGDRLLSPTAAEVMTLAARLVGNNPERVPGPPAVLVAALKIAVDSNRDAVAVAFTEELPGLESSHPFTKREPVLRRVAEAAGSISDFSLLDPAPVDFGRIMRWPLPQILSTSAELAAQDRGPTVDVIHLLVACVSGRVEVLPDAVPSVLGLSGEDLKSRLGLAIQTVRPITLSQPWPPWWAVALDIAAPLEEPIDKPAEAGAPIEPEPGPEEAPAPANFLLSGGLSGDAVPSLDGATKFVDELDVQTYVSMLALAIADRNTPMPLSVGLFGEWGTGKSYFMRLLQQEIGELTSRSGEPGSTFLSDIVHINFNAWHYSDANLWASLADEIFEQLAGRDGVADPNAGRRDKLREELGRTLNKRKELEESTTQARARAEELRGELEAEKANHEASAIGVAKALWADPEVKKQLDVAADKLGLNKEDEIQRLADELSGTHRDARSTWQLLASAKWSTGRAVTLILALLLGLGAVLIADQAELKWAGLAAIAAAATSVTKFLSGLRQGMVALQSGMVKARELKRTATTNDLKDKISELQAAEANVQVASAQLDEVVAKVGKLGRELAELNPGSRLYAFLAERAASAEYQQQLGIVSMIRKDFEQLVALIATWTKERDDPPPAGETTAGQPPPLDRIVLYIDDLDRCEPSQVVDVLQAVHLLLAMNLFVVVVGVDPRWLQRSLRLRYQGIMGASDEVEQDGFRGSTPNDYLEKIFNIPLVLPAMDKKGFSKLLRVMAYGSSKPTPSPDPSPKPAGPSAEAIVPVEPAPIPSEHPATEDAPPEQPVDVPASDTPTETPQQAPVAATEAAEAAAAIASAAPLTGQEGSAVDDLATGKQPVIQPLTDRELEFLDELGPLVRTPRSAKRMFNLYRMLRSARSVEEASEFLGTERRPGEYQAVAQLLAILTAHPKVLGHIITARPDPGENRVRPGGLLHRPPDGSWKEFVEGLALNYHYAQDGTTIIAENALLASIPPADRPAWSEIATALIELLPKVKQTTIRPYQEWAPQVARFSFLLSPFAAEVEIPPQEAQETETTPEPSPA